MVLAGTIVLGGFQAVLVVVAGIQFLVGERAVGFPFSLAVDQQFPSAPGHLCLPRITS
jgi:hypothetical protein